MTSLDVDRVVIKYGRIAAVRQVTFAAKGGTITALLGVNGAGKTSLLRGLAGLERVSEGTVVLNGQLISGHTPWWIARRGVVSVLAEARVFPRMSVAENLDLGSRSAFQRQLGERLVAAALEAFPVVSNKRTAMAGSLSGGERQQLAIVQALAAGPRVLLLDEPSVGLQPAVVTDVYRFLRDLRDANNQLVIIVAEQMTGQLLAVADNAIVLDHGSVRIAEKAATLRDSPTIAEIYLGT